MGTLLPTSAPRYGIADWYGHDLASLTPAQRQNLGRIAVAQAFEDNLDRAPPCPFLANLTPGARCNKAGGVCAIRRYRPDLGGQGLPMVGDRIVTLCPARFLQPLATGASLFQVIGDKMLGVTAPIVVKETPFLRKIGEGDAARAAEHGPKAGRIDWILVDPASLTAPELQWCAVETQSLYFSGTTMQKEFLAYAQAPGPLLYPVGKRRPDYRSSGPKRLLPQLAVKVPVLRNWGKKMVVIVDRYFLDNMNTLADAFPRAKNDVERRDNAEVAWVVVDYDAQLHLMLHAIHYTTLDASRHALNATDPLSKADFTRALKAVIANPARAHKVFTTS